MLFYIKYSALDTFHMIRRETMAKKFNGLERETEKEREERGSKGEGERERERARNRVLLTKALMTYDSNLREERDTYSG